MKTKSYHVSNFGAFGGGVVADTEGYVTIHDSQRYATASEGQLAEWAKSGRTLAIRNAAQTEINERRLRDWQQA